MSLDILGKIVSNPLVFSIDIEKITSHIQELKKELTKDLNKGAEGLAKMTHAKTLELATTELDSLARLFKDNVEFSNPAPHIWVVTLKKPAVWIDDGRKCVVYGKNNSHIPMVLTVDGEIPITKLKKGMLVLNQFGKCQDAVLQCSYLLRD